MKPILYENEVDIVVHFKKQISSREVATIVGLS